MKKLMFLALVGLLPLASCSHHAEDVEKAVAEFSSAIGKSAAATSVRMRTVEPVSYAVSSGSASTSISDLDMDFRVNEEALYADLDGMDIDMAGFALSNIGMTLYWEGEGLFVDMSDPSTKALLTLINMMLEQQQAGFSLPSAFMVDLPYSNQGYPYLSFPDFTDFAAENPDLFSVSEGELSMDIDNDGDLIAFLQSVGGASGEEVSALQGYEVNAFSMSFEYGEGGVSGARANASLTDPSSGVSISMFGSFAYEYGRIDIPSHPENVDFEEIELPSSLPNLPGSLI